MSGKKYYCVPDIHGRYDLLVKALAAIKLDSPSGATIIFLGDYIDRGTNSSAVLDALMAPEEGFEYICLMGNHEDMFIDVYNDRAGTTHYHDAYAAVELSGIDIDVYKKMTPEARKIALYSDKSQIHKYAAFMKTLLPFFIKDQNVFVHAYYDDRRSPDDQKLADCYWLRMNNHEPYENSNQNLYLVHGHTPVERGPISTVNRVNLDCGAVFFGRLVIGVFKEGAQGLYDTIQVLS